MRDYKFRGKIKNHFGDDKGNVVIQKGTWIYGGITYDSDRAWIDTKYRGQIIVDKETVGQFTGLHDINGKEIYEGDIVKVNAHSYDFGFEKDRIGEIRFIEGCFGFYKQLSEKKYLFNELSTESGYGELEYYEVIGNIYENSDLLKEADNIE